MTIIRTNDKLHEIQMLRAIAASLVVIDHATGQVVMWSGSPSWINDFGWFLGEQGVAIFFVISGFIMSFTTKEFGSFESARTFLLRRIARVVPLYWMFTIVAAILIANGLWLKGRSLSIDEIALSMSFIPYGAAPMRPVLGQGWTLEYEMVFYVIFAVAMIFRRNIGHLIIAVSLIFGTILGAILFGSQTGDNASNVAAYLLAPYLLLFLAGVAAGHFRLHIRSSRPVQLTFCLLGVQVALFFAAVSDFTTHVWRSVFWTIDFIIVLVCLNGLSAKDPQRPAETFERLGDASYSLYLSHIFFVYAVAKIWRASIGEVYPWAYITAALIVSALVAFPLHRFVERPLYKRSAALIDSRRKGVGTSVTISSV